MGTLENIVRRTRAAIVLPVLAGVITLSGCGNEQKMSPDEYRTLVSEYAGIVVTPDNTPVPLATPTPMLTTTPTPAPVAPAVTPGEDPERKYFANVLGKVMDYLGNIDPVDVTQEREIQNNRVGLGEMRRRLSEAEALNADYATSISQILGRSDNGDASVRQLREEFQAYQAEQDVRFNGLVQQRLEEQGFILEELACLNAVDAETSRTLELLTRNPVPLAQDDTYTSSSLPLAPTPKPLQVPLQGVIQRETHTAVEHVVRELYQGGRTSIMINGKTVALPQINRGNVRDNPKYVFNKLTPVLKELGITFEIYKDDTPDVIDNAYENLGITQESYDAGLAKLRVYSGGQQ